MRSISEKHTYLKAANSFPPDKETNNLSFYCKIKSEIPAIKTSLITFVALLGLNAIVNNHCNTTVYVQSFPYNNSEPGPLTTVPSGGTFSEPFRASGSRWYEQTVKVDKTRNLASPLFFGYSFQDNTDRNSATPSQRIPIRSVPGRAVRPLTARPMMPTAIVLQLIRRLKSAPSQSL
ncbi:hypothetical protein N7491_011059 [Penicillium cf. griseofulvum]|uniref:Uncharacterized protein n=1 Tax=Penicillium cf. griseofulvum TaxID=2972120 RepID=A0A9W9N1U9_9EURO|nr:hypothetical protein N7472_001378 [Penicillium cf. griseofulvum]KAJ5422614.1 hypothetical protein N7491_011059 [Penicillium cf. griseofulvum]